jgi:serine protease Do
MEDFNVNANPAGMPDEDPNGNGKKRGGRSSGWMIATLVLAAFFLGAIAMKYIPEALSLSGNAASTPTTAATSPQLTAPPLGMANTSLDLTQGVNIPAIVKADAPAVVGVLNKVSGNSRGGFSVSGDVTQGSGSGVIFRSDASSSYIVTNNHVVAGADSLAVVLSTGEELKARLLGADAQTDLAVLKVEKGNLATIPFGNSEEVQVGETVVAIGNPGTPNGTELAGTVTAGIISAKDRKIQNEGYTFNLLQTDAAVNPGNSGGALVNSKGQLIGINQMKITTSETDAYGNPISAEGLGFAIPINDAQPIITQLMNGNIQRPMLGVTVVEVTKGMAEYNMIDPGVYIQALAQDGPAMKAGLQAGDLIEEIDGVKITSTAKLRDVISKHNIGDTVSVKVYRNSDRQEHTYDLTFGSSTEINQ